MTKITWQSDLLEHNKFENATTWLVSAKLGNTMLIHQTLRFCPDTRSEADFVFAARRMVETMCEKVGKVT